MLVLVLNCGSSSVKCRLVHTRSGKWRARGSVERIGQAGGGGVRRFEVAGGPERAEAGPEGDGGGYAEAVRWLADQLPTGSKPEAIGHRVVHGGGRYRGPVLLTEAVIRDLERLSPLAPLHNPPAITGIQAARGLFPDLPQVAAFDTAFHATLPLHAALYAIPPELAERHGVRRYGFHGHSHRHAAERAARMLGRDDLRLVTLHLGSGCSAAAVRAGVSEDTSMGMTPLEGLVMGTRCGDLDPMIPIFLQRELGYSGAEVERLLAAECGLHALSGGISDMRDLEAAVAAGSERAILAFQVFCYRIRKYVGAYAAALGGLDALVFTGGIGENSPSVRAAVCEPLSFLGLRLDRARNGKESGREREIGAGGAPARILVIPADEELVIARETEAALAPGTVSDREGTDKMGRVRAGRPVSGGPGSG